MERSMKCSVRRQYGALVEGLQVMESYLAEGRANKTTKNQQHAAPALPLVRRSGSFEPPVGRNSRLVTVGITEQGGGSIQPAGDQQQTTLNGSPQTSDPVAGQKDDVLTVTTADDQTVGDKPAVGGQDLCGDKNNLVCSIPDFIRTRNPITVRPEPGQSQSATHSTTHLINYSDIDAGASKLLLVNPDKMFIPSSTQVSKMSHKTLLFNRNEIILPVIAQEQDLEDRAESETRRSASRLSASRSRRCSSVGSVHTGRQSTSPSRVYPQCPGEHHPKTAPIVSLKPPPASQQNDRVRLKMGVNGLMIDLSKSPLGTARSSLTTRTPRHVHLHAPWKGKRELPNKKTRSESIEKGNTNLSVTPASAMSQGFQSNNDNDVLEAVSMSNLPPSADNIFMKKHGSVDAMRSYLRIIPPGFQMPPGPDGATTKSRMENYVKLGADKRIYVTFCQSLVKQPDATPMSPQLGSRGYSRGLDVENQSRPSTNGRPGRIVRFQPIKIP